MPDSNPCVVLFTHPKPCAVRHNTVCTGKWLSFFPVEQHCCLLQRVLPEDEYLGKGEQRPRTQTSHLDRRNALVVQRCSCDKGFWKYIQVVYKKCSSCKDCPICCYRVLKQYNVLTDAYHIIGLAYKFLLTLSVTQVECERSFSTLKYIKNRLRSSLSQQHLEAFMLMSTQTDVSWILDSEKIIDGVAEKSELLQKLLM